FPLKPHPAIIRKSALRRPRAKTEIKNYIYTLGIMQSHNNLFMSGFQLFFCLILDFCVKGMMRVRLPDLWQDNTY
ncbi:hypothetical protein BSR03_19770, partial [Serratia proteamaculans]